MLVKLIKLISPGRSTIPDVQSEEILVTDENDPEATDDGALVRFEEGPKEKCVFQ